MAASYNPLNNNSTHPSPYGSGNPYYNESSGFITPHPAPKKRISNWIKFGVPVVIIIIIAAVVGGVLGSRKSSNNSSSSSNGGSSGSASDSAAASSAVSAKLALGRFATATDSEFMVPLYPSTTNSAFSTPTFVPSTNAKIAWPSDPFQPSSPSVTSMRPDRPRLIAPAYKWQALPNLIKNDPYLQAWNATIFGNATDYFSQVPVVYFMDGPSGILDNAREVKMRIKAFAYAYRMSNDTKWVDRAWAEIQNAAGNGTTSFGPDVDKWNTAHFLDTAEFSAAFGIAYDWLYDMWSDDQKSQIRSTLIKYGLQPGLSVFNGGASFGWWSASTITGNWNCVCNGGLTLASLAILGDDTTNIASQLLGFTINDAKSACVNAVTDDGTWAETANYWYFGTTAHAEMASSLLTATGSDYGLLDSNTNFFRTGQFHMYAYGPTSLFNYGDHGPNKFSTTANSMFLYAEHFSQASYSLHQREQADAAEPWSMFWYDPTVSGAFWDGAPLDHFFDNGLDQWASMRSSWTDQHALFLAIKAGKNQGRQTHNDLDVGDFVLDALGTRWAGELGSGDYRAPDYFTSDAQDAVRWEYYRKMTEGQNTILVNKTNQNVLAAPTVQHNSSGTTQGASTVINIPSDSTAYWTSDISSAYFSATSVKRGARLLNARRQVLVQDEITASQGVQWRMHTNATVSIDQGGTSVTLTLDGQTMKVSMLNPPSGAVFTRTDAVRFTTDVTPPAPDQDNPGVSVLVIDLPAGTYSLQVLFNPQWPGMAASDFVTPPSVALDNWSLTSHN
ncbi:chondroitin AC/alginate lyase [Flammula alnicola]|nr:chondroitin AC/alginate lyase [Flammula alnicola]